ncbi:MAG: glycosyltransferase family 2 protein [Gemmatimonadaceae bacterium]
MPADRSPVPDVSAIVVTWDGWSLTRRAIQSLYAEEDAQSLRLEVIVVDNNSTDETPEALPALFPRARYLRLDGNYGFAIANNRALPLATAPLIVLFNNDAVAQRGALRALVDAARAAPDFAIFAPQMIQLRRPSLVDNRGLYLDASTHIRQIDTGTPVSVRRDLCEVFGASAGACLLRREVMDHIGLFDESLGTYWEDCDFALRARAAGYRCLYVPDAHVLHEGSATTERMGDWKLYHIHRNMPVVCRRWLPFRARRLSSWLWVARELYYVVRGVATGRGRTVLRAKRDAWRHPTGPWRVTPEQRARLEAWLGVKARPATIRSADQGRAVRSAS